jgi:hypothetical protein
LETEHIGNGLVLGGGGSICSGLGRPNNNTSIVSGAGLNGDGSIYLGEDEAEYSTPVRVGNSKRRTAFTNREKLDILARYDQFHSLRAVSKETGVARRVIRRWLSIREYLTSPETQLERCRVECGGRKLASPVMESRLLVFWRKTRADKNVVTHFMLQEKAREVA